ncbi:molybdopterin-dependent oxidoreductase [Alicyclobacillus sp. SO9]|uniref:molybdopterin-dependent oxidoreductase n=1 Tax=Alicyclobacillus sp. SO9 TaxID=2665646 RepID=UPI0018E88841|nr:molybdopterin-dependent oxidoreductase [Alicyclobacillus sp. SO9]QQE78869.1 molybdopterin-dependent oxidoreductase [Alicyclobacillus sp. SO9]
MSSFAHKQDGVFPAVCSLDCPDQCGLLVHKKDGKIVKVEGDPSHPVTQGHICNKVRQLPERIYDKDRLQYPLKRIGKKGEGVFQRITWDEAIATITAKWKERIENQGPDRILPYSFYGNMGQVHAEGMDRRFFNRLGASRLDQTICNSAGSAGYGYTMGGSFGTPPEDTIHAKLFIFWGINAVSTNMHQVAIAERARKHGAKIVVIDVHKNQTGRWADWFIPVLPGTDTALALGLMHVLFEQNYVNEGFLRDYTVGSEELRHHVKQYTPEIVSKLTGVPAANINRLAALYGETLPSFIRIGNGLQHHDNGGMAVRTIACLPALTGQWLHQGGGALKGNSGYLQTNSVNLQRPHLRANKRTRTVNMNQLGDALLSLLPPILSLYVYNSNPAIVAPEGTKVRQGLMRENLFTVVHDLFVTETAKYADIVLPATSSFENTDLYTSYWHQYMQLQQPVAAPYGESKSNSDVFRLLAKAMGYDDPEFDDTDVEMIQQALDNPSNPRIQNITFDELRARNFMKAQSKPLFPGRLPTPSGKIELYSEQMARHGYPPLPTFKPLIQDSDAPYLFVPGPNHHFLNTTFANNMLHQQLAKEPKLYMNGQDAENAGINDGDVVSVYNHRGICTLTAAVGEDVLPGVVVSQGLFAEGAEGDNLVNTLTPDRLADMGGGATFFSGRVYVEKMGK